MTTKEMVARHVPNVRVTKGIVDGIARYRVEKFTGIDKRAMFDKALSDWFPTEEEALKDAVRRLKERS